MMPVTYVTAGVLGLLVVVLGLRVSALRRADGVSVGDGGSARLVARIRAHGNAVETVPLALILLGLVEQAIGPGWLVGGLAILLIVARLLHPIGMERPAPNVPRVFGMIGTWSATGVLALLALWQGVVQHGG